MGSGRWDSHAYVSSARSRAASGMDDFDYDSRVKTGRARGIHPDLDPVLLKNGIRESRDSDEHPESLPVAVFFDVTGSMGGIPRILQQKLERLMDVVIAKAAVPHPQILVGAIGDAYIDRYPFQVGQFESDNRFDEQLRNIILEGGGGGQVMESYGLAYRFAAYHTAIDSFEKRGKRGYVFTMGDEMPWPTVTAEEVSRIFGIEAVGDEPIEELIAKAQEKWEIFHLFAMDGSYPNRKDIHDRWRQLLGEQFVMVEDSALVCEIIAGLIFALESAKDVHSIVDDMGLSGPARAAVTNALVPVVARRVPATLASGAVPELGSKRARTIRRL